MSDIHICNAKAEDRYSNWDNPDLIISDGAYGLSGRGGFSGDAFGLKCLERWYRPHMEVWSVRAKASTVLWLWNREVGWATLHPLLSSLGWEYRSCCVWNKGISHVSGRSNTQTLGTFPVATEICVHYVRNRIPVRNYLRSEWQRSGLPMNRANEACEVKNAATRKYLTADHLWYMPPENEYRKMAAYLNRHGNKSGCPYLTKEWSSLASFFSCPVGRTNVWDEAPIRGKMRWADAVNQKPDALIEMLVETSSASGAVVWEPFGGTFPVARACRKLGRKCFAAECDSAVYQEFMRREGLQQ